MSERDLRLQVLLQAIDRATAPIKAVANGSRFMAQTIQTSRDQVKGLEDAQRKLAGFRGAIDSVKESGEAYKKARAAVGDYQGKLDAHRLSQQALSAKVRTARTEMAGLLQQMKANGGASGDLNARYAIAKQQLEKLETSYSASDSTMRRYRTGLKEAEAELKRAGASKTKATEAARKHADALKAAGLPTRDLARQQEELAAKLARATAAYERQKIALQRLVDLSGRFRNMASEVGRLARNVSMMGIAAGGSIFAISNSAASLGDEVAKKADALGLPIAALQELRYAAERSGVSTEKLDGSMQRFVRGLGQAVQGTGKAKKAYEQLGLSAAQLSRMSPEAAMGVVADRLGKINNHASRAAYATAIFGEAGTDMLNMLRDGSAGLESLREQARLTGYVLGNEAARNAEEYKDALLDAQLAVKGMKNTVGAALMPAVTELMKSFSGWMREHLPMVQSFAATLGSRLSAAAPHIVGLARGFATMAENTGAIISRVAAMVGGFENLGMILGAVFASKAIFSVLAFVAALFKAGGAIFMLAKVALPMALAGIKTLTMALVANPIGAAIAVIAGAAFLIYRNWAAVSGFFAGIWGEIKQAFSGGILGIGALILNWSPLGLFHKALAGVLGWFGIDLPAKFSGFGAMLIDGLVSGFTGALGRLKDAVTGAGGAAAGWLKEKLGIRSPSRVFAQLGSFTMEGFTIGLQGSARASAQTVFRAVRQITEAAGSGMTGAGAGLQNTARDSAQAVFRTVRQLTAAAGLGMAGAGVAVAAGPGITIDERPPLASAPVGGGGQTVMNYTININAAPGTDTNALRAMVRDELERHKRELEARQRSSLADFD